VKSAQECSQVGSGQSLFSCTFARKSRNIWRCSLASFSFGSSKSSWYAISVSRASNSHFFSAGVRVSIDSSFIDKCPIPANGPRVRSFVFPLSAAAGRRCAYARPSSLPSAATPERPVAKQESSSYTRFEQLTSVNWDIFSVGMKNRLKMSA
jgi:hypothetical protein